MTGKIRIELEGDAYTDAITTADKFIETVVERLTRIEELVEDNRDAVENIAEAVKSLENAMKILKDG